MRAKVIILVSILIIIVSLALFGIGIKDNAYRNILSEVDGYDCDNNDGLCTTCMIDGNLCECDEKKCDCEGNIVDREECEFG